MTNVERVITLIDWLIFTRKIVSRRQLSEKMGYKESYLSQILNSKVPVTEKFLKKLSIIGDDVDYNWLLTGNGEMLKADEYAPPKDLKGLDKMVPLRDIYTAGVQETEKLIMQMLSEKKIYHAEIVDSMMAAKDELIDHLKKEGRKSEDEIQRLKDEVQSLKENSDM